MKWHQIEAIWKQLLSRSKERWIEDQTTWTWAESPRLAGISAYEQERSKTPVSRTLWVAIAGTIALCLCAAPVGAQDLTIFGGTQRHGKLMFDSAPGTAANSDIHFR